MLTPSFKTIADLKTGERAIIRSFSDQLLSLKLLEMGCLPGTEISLQFIAPFGDPIGVQIDSSYCLSMRKAEAATVVVLSL